MSSYISRLIQVGNGILYYVLNSTLHTDVNTTAFVYLSYLLTVNSVCCCLTVSNWILICDLFCFCFPFILHRFWSWQEMHRKILKWNVSRLVTCNWPFAETRSWTAWSKQPLPAAASFRIYTSRLSARKRILCRIPSERAMSFFRRLINYISIYFDHFGIQILHLRLMKKIYNNNKMDINKSQRIPTRRRRTHCKEDSVHNFVHGQKS